MFNIGNRVMEAAKKNVELAQKGAAKKKRKRPPNQTRPADQMKREPVEMRRKGKMSARRPGGKYGK